MSKEKDKKSGYVLIMILYLAGIFMGAIDTGIVTPARTIIQNELGVSASSGIWMITIYTLSYAASVPVMGKLADKFGRKYVYIICITLFGLGSLFCGLSGLFGGFPVLIAARVIQAIGGGGIVPIATAEFGTTFPEDKRGLALGLVGGVYGIANVFGASAGSAVLDIFGTENWAFIFYINIPISLFIVICGSLVLKNNRDMENNKKIDFFGITALTVMVLSLLYGLKNIDFFNFTESVASAKVYPFLIVFAVFVPVFIFAEKKAEDPVLSLRYFTERNILITLILSTVSGFLMMGVIFVPQFAENCLKLQSGSGGYLVIALGLFAGVGAPVSGKLIDKYGPKIILAFGFLCTAAGALFMMFVTTKHPSIITVLTGLALAGLGMGFTMGTPVNYMMLAETDPKQSNSSLAALSLVRSVGTAIAPAIMVGFVASAGMNVQSEIMAVLPEEIKVPELPYADEIEASLNEMKENPQFSEMLEGMPSFSSMKSVKMDMSGSSGITLPEGTLEMLQSSDVTTITDNMKTMSEKMFAQMTPGVIEKITDGINKGIEGIGTGIDSMKNAAEQMSAASEKMPGMPAGMPEGVSIPEGMPAEGMPDMSAAIEKMNEKIADMEAMKEHMTVLRDAVPEAFDTALKNYTDEIESNRSEYESVFQKTLNKGFSDIYKLTVITAALALIILIFYKQKKTSVSSTDRK